MPAKVHCNPTIVVKGRMATVVDPRYALLEVYAGMPVVIKGGGFQPGEIITITICRQDTLMTHPITANDCGAFVVNTTIPSTLTPGVVSLKALNGEVVRAAWPLDIISVPAVPPPASRSKSKSK